MSTMKLQMPIIDEGWDDRDEDWDVENLLCNIEKPKKHYIDNDSYKDTSSNITYR